MSRHAYRRRRAATALEFAFTLPIAFFLILVTIVGGMGVFRYQQMAALTREGARWASVHGGHYEDETGNPAATPEDVFNEAILPLAVGLRRDRLSYQVTWDRNNRPLYVDNDVQTPKGNTVTVTLTYQWFPEVYLAGPYNLTSTSTAQMAY
jgi:hypothetical protein